MKNTEKTIETLTKELSTLNSTELHELFMFYYKLNHIHSNLTTPENFEKFLESFDKNPFNPAHDKEFSKQLTENLITYTEDHMSLITAIILIKKKFTIREIIENYYSNIDVFDNNLF